jgi:predicted transcriptional regulator
MDVSQMKQLLLDALFMSEKRAKDLLLLKDGLQEMQYFLFTLNTTRQTLLPQVRMLEEHTLLIST